jgi:hypothetical protein
MASKGSSNASKSGSKPPASHSRDAGHKGGNQDKTEKGGGTLSHTTTDHDEIRAWVERHRGKPACVKGTGDPDDLGILRIDFPGGTGTDKLQHVEWDEWFGKFDENKLAFLYQDHKKDGSDSTFFKLVSRES